jgi:hypothetical protein
MQLWKGAPVTILVEQLHSLLCFGLIKVVALLLAASMHGSNDLDTVTERV